MTRPHARSILLIHRYYTPDAPPYGHFLRDIAGWLVVDGYRVCVLSTQPSYNEATAGMRLPRRTVEDGVVVRRMRLLPERKHQMGRRVLNTVVFLMRVFATVLRRRDDLVTFSTMPPVALGLVVRAALAVSGRRGRFVYHCQDLFPETVARGGAMSLPHRLLRRLDAATMSASAATIVLSEDMRRTAVERGVPPDRLVVVNNYPLGGTPTDEDRRSADRLVPGGPRPLVLFAGNLGRFQQLDTVVAAAHLLAERGVPATFVLMGDGAARAEVEAGAGPLLGERLHLLGYQRPALAAAVMARADIGLVTLRDGLLDAAFPSKTLTYLQAGCPLLVTSRPGTDLAQRVTAAGVGRVCPPGDAGALAEAVAAMGPATAGDRALATRLVAAEWSASAARQRWTELVRRVVPPARD